MNERIVYLTCVKCNNNTLRYSSTIDGLRCQHCGIAYLNCEQVDKMVITAREDAFMQGAKWWEFWKTSATMWQSDQADVLTEAKRRTEEQLWDKTIGPQ